MDGGVIVIEGVDGAGKSVQTALLSKRLIKAGVKVKEADFPRYTESTWGWLIGRFLTGEFGKLSEINPYLTVLMYMLDEYTWSRDIGRGWVKKGMWVVANRYFTSNVHQVAKLKGVAQKKFREWVWHTGYEVLGIIKPTLVIYLNVSPNVSRKLILKKLQRRYLKSRKRDIAERDIEHQIEARKEYLRMVKNQKGWVKVECESKGKLDHDLVIHERVWAVVRRTLNIKE